jgi:hypothetical protein
MTGMENSPPLPILVLAWFWVVGCLGAYLWQFRDLAPALLRLAGFEG